MKNGSVSVREQDQARAALAQAVAQTEVARQAIQSVEVGRSGLVAQVSTIPKLSDAAPTCHKLKAAPAAS